MASIFVKDRKGKNHELKAENGLSIMEIIRDAGLEIEAACGGCCACATCHIYVENKWINKLKDPEDEESSMLDQALEVKDSSRLSCQLEFSEIIDGMQVTLAPE